MDCGNTKTLHTGNKTKKLGSAVLWLLAFLVDSSPNFPCIALGQESYVREREERGEAGGQADRDRQAQAGRQAGRQEGRQADRGVPKKNPHKMGKPYKRFFKVKVE